jgi:hypothetical protein
MTRHVVVTRDPLNIDDQTKDDEGAGHVASMGEMRNTYKILVVNFEGKRPLERPRRRWEDNIKTNLRKIGMDLTQDKDSWGILVNTAMNIRVT